MYLASALALLPTLCASPQDEPNFDSLLASTYVGGSRDDDTYEPTVAVDAEGFVYLSGFTHSPDFTHGVPGHDSVMAGPTDRFVAKFDPELGTLLAATFIGGTGYEFGMGIAFDEAGNVLVAGYTNSGASFPKTDEGFVNSEGAGLDAFVVKLDSDLMNLLAVTRFGGSGDEGQRWPRIDMAVGSDGDVYVAGITKSADFPIVGGHDDTYGGGQPPLDGGDAFVARFDAGLTELKASTYLGGSGDEWRVSLVLDHEDNVLVSGDTMGRGFPTTPGCFDSTCSAVGEFDTDMFITKFNSDLSKLVGSTFYGADGEEDALALRVAKDGSVFVAGYTTNANCPVGPNATFSSYNGGARDMVIAKFDPLLTKLVAGAIIGGDGAETAEDFMLDEQGRVYVAGLTTSSGTPFPTVGPGCFSAVATGGEDCFIAVLGNDLNTLLGSTLIGGFNHDRAQTLALGNDSIYISGRTNSDDYPLEGEPHRQGLGGSGYDLFISRFSLDLGAPSDG